MKFNINLAILMFSVYLSGCNGSSSGGDDPDTGGELTAATMAVHYEKPKTLTFRWSDVSGATYYQLFENADGHSGFEPGLSHINRCKNEQNRPRIAIFFDK
ncbi:hypothetical protein [Microbulbifer sp. JTAC008]|uniref:hypothetical protein n=1 Tax=unclassified Microbulbifer TaxID=2619833 RepID=UPI0040399D06